MKQALLSPFAPHHHGENFYNTRPNAVQPVRDGIGDDDDTDLVPGNARHDNEPFLSGKEQSLQPGASSGARAKNWLYVR